jgi:hypothetical protein
MKDPYLIIPPATDRVNYIGKPHVSCHVTRASPPSYMLMTSFPLPCGSGAQFHEIPILTPPVPSDQSGLRSRTCFQVPLIITCCKLKREAAIALITKSLRSFSNGNRILWRRADPLRLDLPGLSLIRIMDTHDGRHAAVSWPSCGRRRHVPLSSSLTWNTGWI